MNSNNKHIAQLYELDLNLLKTFIAIFREKNVSQAATHLNLAQSSLSHSLKRLRQVFDDELFIRTAQGMQATPKAVQLEPLISECFQGIEQALNLPTKIDPKLSERTFIIGGSDFSAFTILPSLINHLRLHAPKIRLQMKPFLPDEAVQKLDQEQIDFAIIPQQNLPKRILQRELFQEDMVIICNRQHPNIGQKSQVCIEEYAALQHIFIASKGEGERIIDKALKEKGLRREIYLTVQNFLIAPYIVENSELIATMSRRVANQCSQLSRLNILPFPIPIESNHFSLVWHKTKNSDQEIHWLMNIIQQQILENGKPFV